MSGLSNNCSVLDLKVSSTGASINVRIFPRHTISRIGMRRSYRLAVSSFNKLSYFNGTVVTQQLKKIGANPHDITDGFAPIFFIHYSK